MNTEHLKQMENDLWRSADTLRANSDLKSSEYFRLIRTDKTIPGQLLKNFSNIRANAEGDIFGQIYECFLGSIP